MSSSGILQIASAVSMQHLTPSELAAYVDRTLANAERLTLEDHLEKCAECRAEVIAVRRASVTYDSRGSAGVQIVQRSTAPISRRLRTAAGAGALAASVLMLLVIRQSRIRPPRGDEVRATSGVSDTRAVVSAVAPVEGAVVSKFAPVFRWHATNADAYRFTLLTESGEVVWSREIDDTVITLPAGVALRQDSVYFWHVDALRDGVGASTGPLRVHVVR